MPNVACEVRLLRWPLLQLYSPHGSYISAPTQVSDFHFCDEYFAKPNFGIEGLTIPSDGKTYIYRVGTAPKRVL